MLPVAVKTHSLFTISTAFISVISYLSCIWKTILVGTHSFLTVVYSFLQAKSRHAFPILRCEARAAPFPALCCCQPGRLLPFRWASSGCGTHGGWVSSFSAALGCPKERREHLCHSHPLKDKWHGVEVYPGTAELWGVLSWGRTAPQPTLESCGSLPCLGLC